jgi:hypothetical protein
MTKKILFALPLILLPSLAAAQSGPGSGDVPRVQREVEAMQRDGRWGRLLAEGQANRQATSPNAQARPTAVFTAIAPNQRRRK